MLLSPFLQPDPLPFGTPHTVQSQATVRIEGRCRRSVGTQLFLVGLVCLLGSPVLSWLLLKNYIAFACDLPGTLEDQNDVPVSVRENAIYFINVSLERALVFHISAVIEVDLNTFNFHNPSPVALVWGGFGGSQVFSILFSTGFLLVLESSRCWSSRVQTGTPLATHSLKLHPLSFFSLSGPANRICG